MENTEAVVSSTATLTWHDFLERMRQPSATEFVKAIKGFIVSFSNNAPDPERDSASVQEFLRNMEAAFRAHPLWEDRSEEELDSAGEGLEKYIMTKLFTRVFASHPDDVKLDNKLHEKSALIQQFIRPEHLDIKPMYQNETSWLLAQKELQKINIYKAPRDKLVCILSCCKVISNLLFNASVSADENPPGADDFLPVLIYVTIKANPPQLHSNLLYIQRFRRESRLVGEAAYFFTNMLSAESFILNIDAKALSMDETEFAKNMESAQTLFSGLSADYNGENTQSPSDQRRTVSDSKPNEIPSVSDLENKGATMLLNEEKVNEKFQNFPYLYSKAGDLTVGDVENLLNDYKQLVFKYVCLAKGLGVPVPPLRSAETRTRGETAAAPEGKGGVELDRDVQVDFGRIEGGGKGLGVLAPPLQSPETRIGGETAGGKGDAEFDRDAQVDIRRIEGGGKGLGVPVPLLRSPEIRIGGETVDAPEGKGDIAEGKVDLELDCDATVDGGIEGGRNGSVGESTPESPAAGEVVSQPEENVEK